MKKIFLIVLVLLISLVWIYAQNEDINAKYKNSAREGEIDIISTNIENFQDASSWLGTMPRDQGIIRILSRETESAMVVADNGGKIDGKNYCLGAKIAFFKSGLNWFAMTPPREIYIPGYTKELQIWAHGRNKDYLLSAIISDIHGRLYKTSFGKLNFPGWNKLTSRIGKNIDQDDPRIISQTTPRGIRVQSIVVETDMLGTYGIYYLYLDNLVAETDIFMEREEERAKQSGDFMSDDW